MGSMAPPPLCFSCQGPKSLAAISTVRDVQGESPLVHSAPFLAGWGRQRIWTNPSCRAEAGGADVSPTRGLWRQEGCSP